MSGYRIPRMADVLMVGALWLGALAVALVLTVADTSSVVDAALRVAIAAMLAAGGVFLYRSSSQFEGIDEEVRARLIAMQAQRRPTREGAAEPKTKAA